MTRSTRRQASKACPRSSQSTSVARRAAARAAPASPSIGGLAPHDEQHLVVGVGAGPRPRNSVSTRYWALRPRAGPAGVGHRAVGAARGRAAPSSRHHSADRVQASSGPGRSERGRCCREAALRRVRGGEPPRTARAEGHQCRATGSDGGHRAVRRHISIRSSRRKHGGPTLSRISTKFSSASSAIASALACAARRIGERRGPVVGRLVKAAVQFHHSSKPQFMPWPKNGTMREPRRRGAASRRGSTATPAPSPGCRWVLR